MSDGAAAAVILQALGILMLERLELGRFRLLGVAPVWLQHLAATQSDGTLRLDREGGLSFLENFLIDAEDFWSRNASGTLASGLWCETAANAAELPLQAFAVAIAPARKLLLIEHLGEHYESRRILLQRARETQGRFDSMQREIQKKEILLDCIVHDLRQPLTGIVGALSLIGARPLDQESRRELTDMGLRLARKQDELIRQILEVFSTDLATLRAADMDPRTAPDLLLTIGDLCSSYRAAFEARGVELCVTDHVQGERPVLVFAKRDRLERVLANFLANALEHAPRASTVEVQVAADEGRARVSFLDRGPGVDPALLPRLFQRFARPTSSAGFGLGLYFCRITCELWGGAVGYAARPGGGASFWCEFARLPPVVAVPPSS